MCVYKIDLVNFVLTVLSNDTSCYLVDIKLEITCSFSFVCSMIYLTKNLLHFTTKRSIKSNRKINLVLQLIRLNIYIIDDVCIVLIIHHKRGKCKEKCVCVLEQAILYLMTEHYMLR